MVCARFLICCLFEKARDHPARTGLQAEGACPPRHGIEALEELRAARFDEALLWVHADNRRARRFYEAAGWRTDGAERDEEAFGHIAKELRHRIPLGETMRQRE